MAENDSSKNGEKLNLFVTMTEFPDWMNHGYFEQVLRESVKDESLKLLDYHLKSATKPGDNFASVALRLRATYQTQGQDVTKSFIVKLMHYQEGMKKELMQNTVLFETEIQMYVNTIPEMQRVINTIDPTEIIAPPVSYHSLSPHKVIFIEDISPEFIMSEKQLDFEESCLVFRKIAVFHALSFFLGEAHEPMKEYKEGFVSKLIPTNDFISMTLGVFGSAVSAWGDEMEAIAGKVNNLKDTLYDKLLTTFERNTATGYNVLNHGDFHIKNILFRNQKDFPRETDKSRLIDFQLSIWATPAIDIIFALYGIVGHEARNRREDLIRHYHDTFTDTLKKLGYINKVPTLLDLQVELLRNGLLELFMLSFLMPMLCMEAPKEDLSMEELNAARIANFNEPTMKRVFMENLRIFNHKGFLDV